MNEIKSTELDDIDRESLVKDIEQIRQAVCCVSNTETSDARSESDFEENEAAGRESEESDDELAVIRSPSYQEDTSEENTFEKQIPTHVISSDSEKEEAEHEENIQNVIMFPSRQTHLECSQDISEDVSYEISQIVPRENTDEVELLLTPVNQNAVPRNTQGTLIVSPSTYQARCAQYDCLSPEIPHSGYTLTELQPAEMNSSFQNKEFDEDVCWSPVYEMNYNLALATSETEQGNWFRPGADEHVDKTGDWDNDNEYGDQSEVHRCLRLNRKYQAVIEDELRRIERSILENKEMQLGLTQMSQSSLTKAEAIAFKQRASYTYPYFKDKSKEGPPDNEDTKFRKDVSQPHPFEKASKPWSREETKILTDAVKSAVLEAQFTPLLRRIEQLIPRKYKTIEEEAEIENLKAEIELTKNLPLFALVQNHALTIDWEDITDKVLPSRTPSQCEMYWYNNVHPLLNKDAWTKDEDKTLLILAKENQEQDWNKIARELKTNRSAVQCLRRYQRSLNKVFLKSKWEKEEDEQLMDAVKICGAGSWEKVSSLLEGRTGAQCMHRYTKSINPVIKRGKWSKEEDDLLRKGVQKFESNWSKIRTILPHRTDAQIRERWSDVLNPDINREKWSTIEDELLLKLVAEQGIGNWTKIATYMKGRNDNRCWRRWRLLKRNDPDFQAQRASYVHRKATMVLNFARRPYDKPAFGPEDVDLDGMPILDPVDGISVLPRSSTATISSTTTTKSSTAEQPLEKKSAKAPKSRQPGGKKRKQKPDGSLNVKRSRNSRPRRSLNESKSNKLTASTPSISHDAQAKAQEKVVNTKTPSSSHPVTTKAKITMPNPTVVSQASALPNGLPINYLTQFSVLLQAFSVDVSGVLKNVQGPEVTTQCHSNPTTTTIDSHEGGTTTAKQPCSQITEARTHENATNTRCPAGKESVINKIKIHDDGRTEHDSCDIVVARDIRNCSTNGETGNSSCGIISQEQQNTVDPSNASDSSQVMKTCCDSNSVLHEVEGTDVSRETDHSYSPNDDTRVSQTAGNVSGQDGTHHDITGSKTCVQQKKNKESEVLCGKEICVPTVEQVRESDQEKRVNPGAKHVSSPGDGEIPEQQERTTNNRTSSSVDAVLSNGPRGLSSDIVIISSSSEEQNNTEGARSKRKTNISTTIANKRRRKVSSEDENRQDKRDSDSVVIVSDLDVENNEEKSTPARVNGGNLLDNTVGIAGVKKSSNAKNRKDSSPRKQYPVRSNRGHRVSDSISVESTTEIGKKIEQSVVKPNNTGSKKRKEKSPNKVVRTTCCVEKGVGGSYHAENMHAPVVPPLPPSATTLKAFKKLLMARKDLKTQVDGLKRASEKQVNTPSKDSQGEGTSETRQGSEGPNVTRGENLLHGCLLVDSKIGEASEVQFRNSLPYQQLVNRFKSLFLWPGFLSIVNPNFPRKGDSNNQFTGIKTHTNHGTS